VEEVRPEAIAMERARRRVTSGNSNVSRNVVALVWLHSRPSGALSSDND
jgi:hypothetical protein